MVVLLVCVLVLTIRVLSLSIGLTLFTDIPPAVSDSGMAGVEIPNIGVPQVSSVENMVVDLGVAQGTRYFSLFPVPGLMISL